MTTTLEESIPACILEVSVEQLDSSQAVTAHCLYPHGFCGFNGHFPKNPVLPAIVQLATVRHIAERILRTPLRVMGCEKAKFRAMIRPDEKVVYHLTLDSKDGVYRSRFKITDAQDNGVASGLCLYTAAN